MNIIKFPFILDAGDGGYYFLDTDTQDGAKALINVAMDAYGYMFEEPAIVTELSNAPAIYNALSLKSYEPLGYTTKQDLFAAYEQMSEFKDTQAYSLDGYEEAVVGVTEDGKRFVYDFNKMLDIMQTRDMMSEEEAMEWYSYNIERSFPYYQPCPIILVSLE